MSLSLIEFELEARCLTIRILCETPRVNLQAHDACEIKRHRVIHPETARGQEGTSEQMPKGEVYSFLRPIFRAVLTMIGDTIRMTFARKKKVISYASAGQHISGTIYYPKSDSPAPSVLLLPTAMGLTPHEHAIAARLAREGYITLALAYTKRTTGAAVVKNEQLRRLLEQIVARGWGMLHADPMADSNYAAVIGFSLGGYFATYIATSAKESPPKAVVNYYGVYALAEPQVATLRTPLLVLQGENDEAEFVNNAKRLKEGSGCNERACKVVFYPDTGHQFDLFEPNSAATRDAWERTLSFLSQHLKPSTIKKE